MIFQPEYNGQPINPSIFGDFDLLDRSDYEGDKTLPEMILNKCLDPYFNDHQGIFDDKYEIGIIINDGERSTPSYLVLDYLIKRFRGLPSRISRIHIATGNHRVTPFEGLKIILGDTYDLFYDRLHIHRGDCPKDHVKVCETSRGTDVRVDRSLFDHDMLIMINSVEPHYFAGFTGGRKSIIPGMAWKKTIEMNHSLALLPESKPLVLEGNPVHEDLTEGMKEFMDLRDHLSIQMVQGPGKILTSVEIGDIEGSFQRAVIKAKEQFCIEIDHRYEIVVTFAQPPMDRTLYQAQKAIENGKMALKKGGTIVLVAPCQNGIGNNTFWELLTCSENPKEVFERINRGYRLGYHKAARIADLSMDNDIYVVSLLDNKIISRGFMRPFSNVEDAIVHSRKRNGHKGRILVIPDGTMTVPIPQE